MRSSFHVLVDSDAFVGWLYENDAHHEKSEQLFNMIKTRRLKLVTTSLVIGETATVLSNRKGQDLARRFFKLVEKYPTIHITEKIHKETTSYFNTQEARGTSFVDCSNVVTMKMLKIPQIFSFDKAYSKQFGVEMVTM